MNVSPNTSAPPTDHHRVADAERAAAARTREAVIAREAHDSAQRSEALSRDALDAAAALADEAAEQHSAAAAAAAKAEASYTATQTAGAWSAVERARSLRDQADVRVKITAATREGAAAALHSARARVAAALAEAERADASAQRAADVLAGLRSNAKVRDDAAAAAEGERLRRVAAYRVDLDALTASARAVLVPKLSAALAAASSLDAAARELSAEVAAHAASASRILAAGRACGALRADETPDALAVPRVLSDLLAPALAAAGLGGGVLAPLASRVPVANGVRALLAAAGVEAPEGVAALDALAAEINALIPRRGIFGEVDRAKARGVSAQTIAMQAAGSLCAAADGIVGGVMYDTAPDGRARVDAACDLVRRHVDLVGRLLSPEVWRWQ